ncbi:ENTH/VHS family protein [Actinidia rufa]|uniref:ENTH/VHS family protein n=1 Tax=Actinidia rufa TaxID=165716 RepID=A0A7J0GB92_9ERIC|nr:ENTH/VHS family protein [Actinidia rufa]
MDSSGRAVESYWRSRMIDGATSDEDEVTPVYKLEEICELLRSSHVSIVKEVSEFILKPSTITAQLLNRRTTSRFSKNVNTGSWGQDDTDQKETSNGETSSKYAHAENKTREERLLETIVRSGGVRLQPTRDAFQVFIVEASKLDALALSHALESKLLSALWQACSLYVGILVRLKAVCFLEGILRRKDVEQFSIVASYFSESIDVVRCSESPQASLREKSNKLGNSSYFRCGDVQFQSVACDRLLPCSRMGHIEKTIKAETIRGAIRGPLRGCDGGLITAAIRGE